MIISLTSLPQNGSTYIANTAVSNNYCSLFSEVTSLGGGNIGNGFVGCIDRVIINYGQVYLLDPLEREVNIKTCGPRPPLQTVRDTEVGAWLLGSGSYIHLYSTQLLPDDFSIRFWFRTFTATGILVVSPSIDYLHYVNIYLSKGRLAVDATVSAHDFPLHLKSNFTYNSGMWYQIIFSYNSRNVTLSVDEEVLSGIPSAIENHPFIPSGELFLGGLPQNISALLGDTPNTSLSVAGCIHQVQIDDTMIDLPTNESYRVDFGGCPVGVAAGIRFMGEGRAEFSIPEQELHSISFGYRSTQLTSLLLQSGDISVSIFHTKIRVNVFATKLVAVVSDLSNNIRHTVFLGLQSVGNETV